MMCADLSPPVILEHGEPQGSVLDPLLFIMYTAEILHNVSNHGLLCVRFADNTQLYFHFKHYKIPVAKAMLEECIQQIHTWLSSNTLRKILTRRKLCAARLLAEREHCNNHCYASADQQSRHLVRCMTLE